MFVAPVNQSGNEIGNVRIRKIERGQLSEAKQLFQARPGQAENPFLIKFSVHFAVFRFEPETSSTEQ